MDKLEPVDAHLLYGVSHKGVVVLCSLLPGTAEAERHTGEKRASVMPQKRPGEARDRPKRRTARCGSLRPDDGIFGTAGRGSGMDIYARVPRADFGVR